MKHYDDLTLSEAIDRTIVTTIIESWEPHWPYPLHAGDEIEDLRVPIPGERQNWVKRTVVVEPRHIQKARKGEIWDA